MRTKQLLIGIAVFLGASLGFIAAPPTSANATTYGPYCVHTIVHTGDFYVGPVHVYPSDGICIVINI